MSTIHLAKRRRTFGPEQRAAVHRPFRSPSRVDGPAAPERQPSRLKVSRSQDLQPGPRQQTAVNLADGCGAGGSLQSHLPTPDCTPASQHSATVLRSGHLAALVREVPDSESDDEHSLLHASPSAINRRNDEDDADVEALRLDIAVLLTHPTIMSDLHPTIDDRDTIAAKLAPAAVPPARVRDPTARLRRLTAKWRMAAREAADLLYPYVAARFAASSHHVSSQGQGTRSAGTAQASLADEDRMLRLESNIADLEKQLESSGDDMGRTEAGLMRDEILGHKDRLRALERGLAIGSESADGTLRPAGNKDADLEDHEPRPFDMAQMLRMMSIDPALLGWDENEEQWRE